MGHIIGKSGRDITESEMEFINSIELIDYDLQSEGEDETEQIKSLIENYIDENGSISQEQIDEFIWDVIGELDNSDELFEEICNNGAFGSYES
jgi:arginine decarboxylase-like protein